MTLTPFAWLLAVLAVYRLAYLMTVDDGPARIFLRFRQWTVRRFGADHWITEGASCLFCQSVWYAAPAALLFPWQGLSMFLLLWLSIAGACVPLHWLVLVLMVKVNR